MANYLIISATSSIGFAVAEKLLHAGHQVFITGRLQEKTEKIANKLKVPFTLTDASDFAAVDLAFEQAISNLGVIHGVVNCAGSLLLKSAHLTRQNEYENVISANLTTAFATVRSAGKYMAKNGGSIVLVSSAASMVGLANHEAIAAAKAGVIGLTLSASATYAAYNLRVNAIAPGLVETEMTKSITTNESALKASAGMHALGRIGNTDDIASAIIFFLAPENNWITGQVLGVDGGLSRIRPKLKM